jgi:hypothetical protein
MCLHEKDEKLQKEIRIALWMRVNINTQMEDGVAHMGHGPDDRIYPELVISAEEIKTRTGRHKLRDSVLLDYKMKLQGDGICVDVLDGMKGLRIAVVPTRIAKNCFSSLAKLQEVNERDLDDDPDLAKPWCD